MSATDISLIIVSLIATIAVLGVTIWFVKRKNSPKVGKTEEQNAQTERPDKPEIDDPLN